MDRVARFRVLQVGSFDPAALFEHIAKFACVFESVESFFRTDALVFDLGPHART